jgi:hypothetical protein
MHVFVNQADLYQKKKMPDRIHISTEGRTAPTFKAAKDHPSLL